MSFSKNNNDNSNGEDGTVLSDTVLNLESNVDGNISIKTSNKDVASASINNNQIKVGVANRVTIKKYAAKSSNTYITFTLTPSDSRNYKTTDIETKFLLKFFSEIRAAFSDMFRDITNLDRFIYMTGDELDTIKNFFGYFPPDMMFKHNDTFKRVFENLWSAAGNDIFQFAALFLEDPFLEYGLRLDLIDGGQGFLTGFF